MSDYTPYDAYTMRKCIERQDATIARLTAENAALREEVENEKRQTAEVERWYRSADAERIKQQTRAEQAEAKVEKVRKWLNGSIINSCPECGQEIGIIDWNALEQILRGEP